MAPGGVFIAVPGTSPRMRGKPIFLPIFSRLSRNIPAYAGKTSIYRGRGTRGAEHPRVCGENAIGALIGILVAGTSPRMRGKHGTNRLYVWCTRNIPAYAGKTIGPYSLSLALPEHPRVCGENQEFFGKIWYEDGTSPRMRGKRMRTPSGSARSRNIPAYAGKTMLHA